MRKEIYVAVAIIGLCGMVTLPGLGLRRKRNTPVSGARLEELAKRIIPEDQPEQAEEFFALKRSTDGISHIPIERYLRAMRKARRMPRHSTPLDAMLPSEEQNPKQCFVEPELFGSWTQLGPGNIGGRTRGFVINPGTPSTMYAAGVAGGVWRTTDSGSSWAPLTDLIANIAVNSLAM